MASDSPAKGTSSNSCCAAWKEKCLKLEERRKILREAVNLLTEQVDKIQAENASLKAACEEERAQAEKEKIENNKKALLIKNLEHEIAALKAELSLFSQKGSTNLEDKNDEICFLQDCIAKGESEIMQLTELLKKEKSRADTEQQMASTFKEKLSDALESLKAEQLKIDEQVKLSDLHNRKDEYRLQAEALQKKVAEVNLQLVNEKSKLDEAQKMLIEEKERADLEMLIAKEQTERADAKQKEAMDVKSNAESLSQQLEIATARIIELQNEVSELHSRKIPASVSGDQLPVIIPWHACTLDQVKCPDLGRKEMKESCKKLGNASVEDDQSNLSYELLKSGESFGMLKLERKHTRIGSKYGNGGRKSRKKKNHLFLEEDFHLKNVSKQLKLYGYMVKDLQNRLQESLSSRQEMQNHLAVEAAKYSALEKRIQLEKTRLKLSKVACRYENTRNIILNQELDKLKRDFLQSWPHLHALEKCFPQTFEGVPNDIKVTDLLKQYSPIYDLEPLRVPEQVGVDFPNGSVMPIKECSPLCPTPGVNSDCGQSFSAWDPLLISWSAYQGAAT